MEYVSGTGLAAGDVVVVGDVPLVAVHSTLSGVFVVVATGVAFHSTVLHRWTSVPCC